jgi:hypothetical protein
MGLNDYNYPVNRSVWENKNGSKVTTVTGLLQEGRYRVSKTEQSDGSILLEYAPID